MEVSIATSSSWKMKGTEEWQTRTTWHKAMFSGKQAEYAAKSIDNKGLLVFIEGETIDQKWVDKHHQNRVTKVIKVKTHRVLSKNAQNVSNEQPDYDNDMAPMSKEEEAAYFGGQS